MDGIVGPWCLGYMAWGLPEKWLRCEIALIPCTLRLTRTTIETSKAATAHCVAAV